MLKTLQCSVTPFTGGIRQGQVIFLHDSDSDGRKFQTTIDKTYKTAKKFQFSQLDVIYPTAPSRPFTKLDGVPAHMWFDHHVLDYEMQEPTDQIEESVMMISDLIDEQKRTKNIYPDRTIVAGYGIGGIVALHLGLRFRKELGAIMPISTFLPRNSGVYKDIDSKPIKSYPPIWWFHGVWDPVVRFEWAMESYMRLLARNADITFNKYHWMRHEITPGPLVEIYHIMNEYNQTWGPLPERRWEPSKSWINEGPDRH